MAAELNRIPAGILSGLAAGLAMAFFMMIHHALSGTSIWTTPNLIAVMWMGEEVAGGSFSPATLVGFATHMATSAVMGVIALPFIFGLSRRRTVLLSLSYALASYPVAFAAVLTWANPLMIERTDLVVMTIAHAVFGLVLGLVYLRLG